MLAEVAGTGTTSAPGETVLRTMSLPSIQAWLRQSTGTPCPLHTVHQLCPQSHDTKSNLPCLLVCAAACLDEAIDAASSAEHSKELL